MADIPVPRSYSEILGDMVDAFLSRYGLRSLKVGSPVLSILESVAQSQLRSSDDIFTLLEAQSLDNASGDALDRFGSDESTPRIQKTPSTGSVTISDTSFTKISSTIYQGLPAPIVGSTAINVVDASLYPTTGSVYLGRGTNNYEGPIAYTSKVNNGSYWTINLSSSTQRFHNQGEGVVVAQGGDRQVAAGTLVQTPQGNTSSAIQFKTLFNSTLLDGETSLPGVLIVATIPGSSGNVAATAINGFVTSPFNGASVSNPLPLTNATDVEDDDTYRERIRLARQTRTKGTALAIQTNAVGVLSTDENKRVLSASVVTRQGYPTTLYIDDGDGYEMVSAGVAIETQMDSALGGEQFFKLNNRPVAKAAITCATIAPYALANGYQLSFSVGGVTTTHTFSDDGTFNSIVNATAYEVVASINADITLNWSARTINAGTQVVVTGKADTVEYIQNVAVTNGTDANSIFNFSTTRTDTVKLYLDDKLLSKDGSYGAVQSNQPANWSALSGPQSFVLYVDGVKLSFDGVQFAKFTDADFIAANTGYTTLGKNSLAAWAAVFNYRIPGITASVSAGTLLLTSNRGRSSNASVQILSGDLVTNHMFAAGTGTGTNSDYTLNRNTGEIGLTSPLTALQKLTLGSKYTRAFLNTSALSTVSLTANANLWLAIDSNATIVPSGLTASNTIALSSTAVIINAVTVGYRVRATSNAASFTSVQAGDWVVFWDSNFSAITGSWRVSYVDPAFTFFEFDRATTITQGATALAQNGVQFWRTTGVNIPPSKQTLSYVNPNTWTATSFASQFNSSLVGANAYTYKTNVLRLSTNTFSTLTGDIALVAQDINGQKVGLSVGNAIKNLTGHVASVESGNSECGTPHFKMDRVQAVTSQTQITIDRLPSVAPSAFSMMQVLRANDTGLTASTVRYSPSYGFRTTLSSVAANAGHWNLVLNAGPEQTWLLEDRMAFLNPFMLSFDDQLSVLVDGDTALKRYAINMYRTVKPKTNSYTATNTFTDTDNSGANLSSAFGTTMNFTDFIAFMSARGITNSSDATRTVLWRYYRLGPDGNNVRIQFQNPLLPNASVGFAIDNQTNSTVDVGITLAGGAARTTSNIRNTTYIGYSAATPVSGMSTVTYAVGFSISAGSRTTNVTTLTLTVPGSGDHGFQTGNVLYVNSADVNFPSGAYSITRVSGTQISYSDPGTSPQTMVPGTTSTVSFDSAGEAKLTGSGAVVGDFFTTINNPFTSLTSRLTAVNAQNWTAQVKYSGLASARFTWAQIVDATKFYIFANPAQTASALVTAFGAVTNKIVSPTLIGAGGGVIDRSSDEDAGVGGTWVTFTDGVNYIQSSVYGADYTFVFKNPVNSTLAAATSVDWQNEVIKLVPSTTANCVAYLNTLGVTGLSSAAQIQASSNAKKLQLSSLTAGSVGSIQVQGGTANSATASIAGACVDTVVTGATVAQVASSSIVGMYAGQYVAINNTNKLPRANVFTTNTTLTSIDTNGNFTFNVAGDPVVNTRTAYTVNACPKFEKHGNFVAISDSGAGGFTFFANGPLEGDWLWIVAPATPTAGRPQLAAGNAGLFRVVRDVANGFDTLNGTVWIENPNFVEQNTAECDYVFLQPNSVLPGDTISIGTSLWGAANQTTWTVKTVGTSAGTVAQFTNHFSFTVDVSTKATTTQGAVAALGANSNLVQCIEGTPTRLIKKILSISQNPTASTTLADVKFDSFYSSSLISLAAGSVMSVLDKFAFTTSTVSGIDGYQYNTGLLHEVNRVEYGDPSDPATYPGVVAAGSLVNIEGAPIRRITVGVALRVRSGAPTTQIAQSAKSAIAAVINATGTGQPIAVIDIANAAKVPGVTSVVMLNPLMVTGSDLINVQPYEKPRVVNLDTDILVSFIGD